jgi:hypothetical protein
VRLKATYTGEQTSSLPTQPVGIIAARGMEKI